MKLFLCILFLIYGATSACCQSFPPARIPEHYDWKTAREYKRDEDLVVRTLQWLCSSPLNASVDYRSKANLFVMEWIAGSPRILINIESKYLPFYENYPDLLFPYIQGVALKKLGKPTCESELEAIVGGFHVVGFMIDTDASLKKEKPLQPILKAYKKNKLVPYVEELLASQKTP